MAFNKQLVIIWEPTQHEIDNGAPQGVKVWQRMNRWYGVTKGGKPSRLKEFVDSLVAQGMLEPGDIEADQLVNVEQRVTVTQYPRQDGQMGNKVAAILPLRRGRQAPQGDGTAQPVQTIQTAPQQPAPAGRAPAAQEAVESDLPF